MTTEDKAREYAFSVLNQRCERLKCNETSCKPYKHKQDELHTRCRSRYHCLRDGYISGYNSRDAEVAELQARIEELTEWVSVFDKMPDNPNPDDINSSVTCLVKTDTGMLLLAHYCFYHKCWNDDQDDDILGYTITHWRKI